MEQLLLIINSRSKAYILTIYARKAGIFMTKKRILSLAIIISIIVGTLGVVGVVTARQAEETPQMPDSLINARSGISLKQIKSDSP